ncbi:S8 family serine peptidase [Neobacillus drentensis]|uniref:S8 family peptidase n=1 Tax=Neobacillus drentensis TaxID=220684 RepID=UPI002FFD5F11
MGKPRLKKSIAALMTTAMLTVPVIQAYANDPSSNDQTAFNVKADNVSVTDTKIATGNHTITLITGDVVTVTDLGDGKSAIKVDQADMSKGFQTYTINEDTYVIPDVAMPYVSSGHLDKDLFNINTLIEDGYDDAKSSTVPVIVQYSKAKARSIGTAPTPDGSKKTHVLESLNGASLSTDKKNSKKFWKDITPETKPGNSKVAFDSSTGIEKVWLDGKVESTLDKSVPQIGAPTAWAAGYNGKGIKIAVLDTGIDEGHPDLKGQIAETKSFVPGQSVQDLNGHGTHVASTIVGTGAASGGKMKGVAPGANLLVGKVLSNEGAGAESWIIDGMEWAAHNAKIVSMSLGSPEYTDGTDPMSQAVNNLSTETGALFVIAAGNDGTKGESTVSAPGAADAALTVGAVDKSDKLAYFSSKGPRFGDMAPKPDLSAPGVNIVAARAAGTSIGTPVDANYTSLNGTSMATPHVAGAAAILLQRHPDWTGTQIKNALMSSTTQIKDFTGKDYTTYQVGTGRLDVAAALGNVHATGTVNFGFFDWPHGDDKLVDRTVTYTNDGDTDVILNLVPNFKDAADNPAPAGLLKLSATSITVPAKGKASVTLTVDPNLGAVDAKKGSRYQGQLVANLDGKTVAHTTMSMVKEAEKYTLTLKAIDRDGSPDVASVAFFGEHLPGKFVYVDGTLDLRLPPDTYSAMSMMDVDADTDHAGVALVGDPEINFTKSMTIDLDARKANEITAIVPNKTYKTEDRFLKMNYSRLMGNNGIYNSGLLPVVKEKMYAVPQGEVVKGTQELRTRWRKTKPVLTINFNGHELDDLVGFGSTPLKGDYSLHTVYAGKGATADYDLLKVKDKAVVVDRNDEVTAQEQAAAALAAGAKLLIIANDKPSEFSEYVGYSDQPGAVSGKIPLAVAQISGTEGEQLITEAKSGKLKLDVSGSPDTPYVYDLVDVHKKAIPEDLTYAPTEDELVKIDARYKSDRPANGTEFRMDIGAFAGVSGGFDMSFPAERTEWVSAAEGTGWYQGVTMTDNPYKDVVTADDHTWQMRGTVESYKPGQRLQTDWFSPIVRPAFGSSFSPPRRGANQFSLNIPAWGDATHQGSNLDAIDTNQKMKLYKGETEITNGVLGTTGQQLIAGSLYWDDYFKEVPRERTQYRLVADAERDPARWHTSVKTHTEWTFWSQYQYAQVPLPFLQINYKVDTDLAGNARAGESTELELSTSRIAGATDIGKIEGVSLQVSFDEGKNWEPATLTPKGEGWVANIQHPHKPGTFVSLKASAWDDAGNRIDQEIIKAYGLK